MRDDYFGVDVELDDINETVFKSSNGTSNNAAKRTPQPYANVRSRKGKRKASPGESSDESISSKITKLTDVCDATRSQIDKVAAGIGKVAKYFDVDKPLIFEIISSIAGLTPEEVVQAYGIISANEGKASSFFSLPNEAAQKIFVKGVLDGLI
ncbi:hypothetical protein CCACVL1_25847 [Corchorus capsularis]|uniref:Uncharacterized protein n=1 Tax=Corchorus capsularis TaxID=210143 RepID=A0A1R3GGV2_COCAP|nr:hypothetical protein CCACVL1_25847 [Corchorus capsularis]